MLLEFFEWNCILIFHDLSSLLCEKDEERENKKSMMIKLTFGRLFIQIEDSKN